MRLVCALLIVMLATVAACTKVESSTATGPLSEPSLSVAVVTTSIMSPVAACEDGAPTTRRGFVCPPEMATAVGWPNATAMAIHLPGEYRTRVFEPSLEFVRTDQFHSVGEFYDVVDLGDGVLVFGPRIGEQVVLPPELRPSGKSDDWEWVADPTRFQIDVGGYPATGISFTAHCYAPDDPPGSCDFVVEGLFVDRWSVVDGTRLALVAVPVDAGSVVIQVVGSRSTNFDAFWSETVQPILDSIRFIDP